MQSVGIFGTSYCGSTMLGCILGSLTDCAYVGETHWLIDHGGARRCRCRQYEPNAECPYTKDFYEEMTDPRSDWWERFARALGVETVVSGDKGVQNYQRVGTPDKAIILKRDPRAWCLSRAHYRAMKEQDQDLTIEELKLSRNEMIESAHVWKCFYSSVENYIYSEKIPQMTVHLERFSANPWRGLGAICSFLELEFNAMALYFETETHHHFGGNSQVGMKKIFGHRPRFHEERRRLRGGFPKPDHLWKTKLDNNTAREILEAAGGCDYESITN